MKFNTNFVGVPARWNLGQPNCCVDSKVRFNTNVEPRTAEFCVESKVKFNTKFLR